MLLPYQVDVPMQRLPLVNWALIGGTIVLSIAGFTSEVMIDSWVLWRNENFHVAQLLTNVAMHGGILHLLGNMLFLFVFGNAVNAKLGHWQFALLYALLGIGSSLCWYITGPGEASLGASGAIMGVVGAYVILYPLNDIACFYCFGLMRSGTFRVSSFWIVGMYILFDVWGLAKEGGATNYVAHVSGMLFGAMAAVALVLGGVARPDENERNLLQMLGWESARVEIKSLRARGHAPVRRKYMVQAADKDTGFATSFEMTAASESEIAERAQAENMVVKHVRPM